VFALCPGCWYKRFVPADSFTLSKGPNMHKSVVLMAVAVVALVLGPSTSIVAQSADDEALKAVVRAETMAFYGRDLDKWLAGWAHDTKASRTLTGNGFYSATTGWDKIAADMSKSMKADPTPIGIQLGIDNFIVHTSGDVAFVEYDQTTTTTVEPIVKSHSREHRVLVKNDGRWKIISQITVIPPSTTPEGIENGLNAQGYMLLGAGKHKEAIEVFKLNVQFFPESWNVYDSLGEAYAAAGNNSLAIVNYEKSVQLNPKNESGKAALAKLKKQ